MASKRQIQVTIPRRLLQQRGELLRRILRVIEVTTQVALERLRSELESNTPSGVGSPPAANSYQVSVDSEEDRIIGAISGIFYIQLLSDGFGGKGVWPPADPIRQWVRRKNLHNDLRTAPWMREIIGTEFGGEGEEFNEIERIELATYFVRRKIATEGVEATEIIEKSVDAAGSDIQKLFERTFLEVERNL